MISLNWKGLKGSIMFLLFLGATIASVIIWIGIPLFIVFFACLATVVAIVLFAGEDEEWDERLMPVVLSGLGGLIASAASFINPSLTYIYAAFFLLILVIGSVATLASPKESKMVEH